MGAALEKERVLPSLFLFPGLLPGRNGRDGESPMKSILSAKRQPHKLENCRQRLPVGIETSIPRGMGVLLFCEDVKH